MNLLKGLSGVDFQGIGDDYPAPIGPPQSNNFSTSGPPLTRDENFISASELASSGVPLQQAFNYLDARNRADSVQQFKAPNISTMMSNFFSPSTPASADTALEPMRPYKVGGNYDSTGSGIFTYAQDSVFGKKPASVVDSITTDASSGIDFVKKAVSQVFKPIENAFGISQSPVQVSQENKDAPGLFKSLFSPSPSPSPSPRVAAALAPAGSATPRLQSAAPTQAQPQQPSGGPRGPVGPSAAGRPGTFNQDFNAITNGILSVVATIVGAKQQAKQQQGSRGSTGNPGQAGPAPAASSTGTYLLIGGGVLAMGLLAYALTKKS